MELEVVGTGERREVCLEELWCGKEEVWCAARMKELEHVRGRDAKAQGQHEGGEVQLERAQRIVETVERIEAQRVEWRGQGGKGREKEQVRKWCGELEEPIGVRTYDSYRQQYERAGGQVQVLAGMRLAQDVPADADESSAPAGQQRQCCCGGMRADL